MLRHPACLSAKTIWEPSRKRGKKKKVLWGGTRCTYNYFPATDLLEGTHSWWNRDVAFYLLAVWFTTWHLSSPKPPARISLVFIPPQDWPIDDVRIDKWSGHYHHDKNPFEYLGQTAITKCIGDRSVVSRQYFTKDCFFFKCYSDENTRRIERNWSGTSQNPQNY